jgi:subtilase family serine protease
MSINQGSVSMRNIPDVSMDAFAVFAIAMNNTRYTNLQGTSISAPLWAGFAALVNEQTVADGHPPVGFLNPALYAIGKGPNYTASFHDITIFNNTNSVSPNRFFAVPGYDLCTGWGTPKGTNLINALEDFAGPIWVAFGGPDSGAGTYDRPYNTLALGATHVSAGGTILFKTAGSSPETMTLSRPMTLRAIGGPATVGR